MGAGGTEESCLLMMLIILFLVSCQNLKHESWAFKGSKQKGAVRSEGLRGVCALGSTTVHTHSRKSCLLLPTEHWLALEMLPNSGHSRAPKAALHPPERAGRLRGQEQHCGHLGPQAAVCESSASGAGKGGEASLLPVPH